jgi:HK97 family phage prohead protease
MKYANYDFLDYKALKDPGTFEALGAVTGNVDLGGDRIDPGAFKKTLKEQKQFPLLYMHDRKEPIGNFNGKETETGLEIKGSFNFEMIDGTGFPAVPNAFKAHALLKRKDIKGFSIGYQVIKWLEEKIKDRWIFIIKELKLMEVSVVTFPMNPLAVLQDIKSEDEIYSYIKENKKNELFMKKLFTLLKEIEPGASTHFLTEPENVLKGHSDKIKKLLGG